MSHDRPNQMPIRLQPGRKRELRTQFGALCWRVHKDRVQVLLVTTRGTRRWTPPKGWPIDGLGPAASAAREAFEEAGVAGRVFETCLGIYSYTKTMGPDPLPCVVALFPLKVTATLGAWPERAERERRWMRPKKAAKRVREPELARILRDFDPARIPR